jgi:hypothetical protein
MLVLQSATMLHSYISDTIEAVQPALSYLSYVALACFFMLGGFVASYVGGRGHAGFIRLLLFLGIIVAAIIPFRLLDNTIEVDWWKIPIFALFGAIGSWLAVGVLRYAKGGSITASRPDPVTRLLTAAAVLIAFLAFTASLSNNTPHLRLELTAGDMVLHAIPKGQFRTFDGRPYKSDTQFSLADIRIPLAVSNISSVPTAVQSFTVNFPGARQVPPPTGNKAAFESVMLQKDITWSDRGPLPHIIGGSFRMIPPEGTYLPDVVYSNVPVPTTPFDICPGVSLLCLNAGGVEAEGAPTLDKQGRVWIDECKHGNMNIAVQSGDRLQLTVRLLVPFTTDETGRDWSPLSRSDLQKGHIPAILTAVDTRGMEYHASFPLFVVNLPAP